MQITHNAKISGTKYILKKITGSTYLIDSIHYAVSTVYFNCQNNILLLE
jgi:hypothetical protein